MIKVKNTGPTDDYVYDISLDGSVVNALGLNVISNTDGFNFQMPKSEDFRYTKENPYISNGKGRNSEEGKAYTGVDADVAEFEDLYLCPPYTTENNKMGLGVDEMCPATINFARKNYADLLDNGKVKLVGNTIKSKKMPIYIEKFLDTGIKLLLNAKGKEFIEFYYDYLEKIYNLKIPLKDIATVGKIKTSLETYKESCQQYTAAGNKKSRQAWYELAIKHNLNVNMGDAIYYINTGNKKGLSDVQRTTEYYYIGKNGERIDFLADDNDQPILDKKGNTKNLTKYIKSEFTKYKKLLKVTDPDKKVKMTDYAKTLYPNIQEEDRLEFNCILLPNDIVEDEDDHFCDDDFEYNKEKYIEMFNKRIRPLLVCFDRSIRTTVNEKGKEVDNILISNPKDRKCFTEEECQLVSGQPYNATDQDTYEQLMSIEDKEIKFWLSVGKEPPYTKECGIDWEEVVDDYNKRMEEYKREEIQYEVRMFEEIVDKLTEADLDTLIEDGVLPEKLLKFAELDEKTNNFISLKYNVKIGTLFDILDKDFNTFIEDVG